MTAEEMVDGPAASTASSRCPPNLADRHRRDCVSRYGRVKLERIDGRSCSSVCADKPLLEELARQPKVREYLGERLDDDELRRSTRPIRGVLKQALIAVGYPAEDLAGYTEGAALPIAAARRSRRSGLPFHVRDYQREAADVFYAGGDVRGGSGVIVLPCGAGKTIVGIAAMALLQKNTLVLTTSITAVKQWRREILDKTDLDRGRGRPSTPASQGDRPGHLATYQILTYRPDKTEEFPHFKLFDERDWGLIIYDEVHLLPAPVFRVTAEIQARRRLGLTATLDPRGRPRGRRLQPDRPEEVRRALARAGDEGLDRRGAAAPRSASPCPTTDADGVRRRRVAQQVPHRQREPGQGRRRRPSCSSSYHDERVLIIGQYSSSSAGSPSGSTCR